MLFINLCNFSHKVKYISTWMSFIIFFSKNKIYIPRVMINRPKNMSPQSGVISHSMKRA